LLFPSASPQQRWGCHSREADKEFFFIPASPEMELHSKMRISVTALKDILPVAKVVFKQLPGGIILTSL